jgi:hypothetical protein
VAKPSSSILSAGTVERKVINSFTLRLYSGPRKANFSEASSDIKVVRRGDKRGNTDDMSTAGGGVLALFVDEKEEVASMMVWM